VTNNILRNIGGCGVCINSSNVVVEKNDIMKAGHELILVKDGNPLIAGNRLGPNSWHKSITVEGGVPIIERNKFENAGVLKYTDPDGRGDGVIRNNVFDSNSKLDVGCSSPAFAYNNFYGLVLVGKNCVKKTFKAQNNFWGTGDKKIIEERVVDARYDPDYRRVVYEPPLTSKVVVE
ncbi:MAG: hypothetical protein GF334_13540, partial [Candidatus Altiarchaeales archaeon]|nr:hypothetical protein [Candidatus Altiarchaeales archaeon]